MTNTGHSLGGMDAQLGFLVNHAPTYTFNPLLATQHHDAVIQWRNDIFDTATSLKKYGVFNHIGKVLN